MTNSTYKKVSKFVEDIIKSCNNSLNKSKDDIGMLQGASEQMQDIVYALFYLKKMEVFKNKEAKTFSDAFLKNVMGNSSIGDFVEKLDEKSPKVGNKVTLGSSSVLGTLGRSCSEFATRLGELRDAIESYKQTEGSNNEEKSKGVLEQELKRVEDMDKNHNTILDQLDYMIEKLQSSKEELGKKLGKVFHLYKSNIVEIKSDLDEELEELETKLGTSIDREGEREEREAIKNLNLDRKGDTKLVTLLKREYCEADNIKLFRQIGKHPVSWPMLKKTRAKMKTAVTKLRKELEAKQCLSLDDLRFSLRKLVVVDKILRFMGDVEKIEKNKKSIPELDKYQKMWRKYMDSVAKVLKKNEIAADKYFMEKASSNVSSKLKWGKKMAIGVTHESFKLGSFLMRFKPKARVSDMIKDLFVEGGKIKSITFKACKRVSLGSSVADTGRTLKKNEVITVVSGDDDELGTEFIGTSVLQSIGNAALTSIFKGVK